MNKKELLFKLNTLRTFVGSYKVRSKVYPCAVTDTANGWRVSVSAFAMPVQLTTTLDIPIDLKGLTIQFELKSAIESIKSIPDGEVTFSWQSKTLVVEGGNRQALIATQPVSMSSNPYPRSKDPAAYTSPTLLDNLTRAAIGCSRDYLRPQLLFVQVDHSQLKSSDAFVAFRILESGCQIKNSVPGIGIEVLQKIGGQATLYSDNCLSIPDWIVQWVSLDTNMPPIDRLYNNSLPFTFWWNVEALRGCSAPMMMFSFTPGAVLVHGVRHPNASEDDKTEWDQRIVSTWKFDNPEVNGKEGEFMVDTTLLEKLLAALNPDQPFSMSHKSGLYPVRVQQPDCDLLIMPMHTKKG